MKQPTTLRRFKKSEWSQMRLIAEPTRNMGQIRADENGKPYVWTHGGRYVYAAPVTLKTFILTKGQPTPMKTTDNMVERMKQRDDAFISSCGTGANRVRLLIQENDQLWQTIYKLRAQLQTQKQGEYIP